MRDVEHQLRDYWSDVVADHRLPSAEALIDGAGADDVEPAEFRAAEPNAGNGTTPTVGGDDEVLVVVDLQPDGKEHVMSTRRWTLIGAAAGAILLAVIAVMIVQDDDTAETDIVDTPDPVTETTAAPTTSTTEAPVPETTEVSFNLLDAGIPDQLTCFEAEPEFYVEFTDEAGDSTVARAVTDKFLNAGIEDLPPNMTCSDVVAADGGSALLYSAVLEAPVADTYQTIRVRYLGDEFHVYFEDIPRAEAEAGLSLEFTDEAHRVIGPEDIEALQLAE